MAASTISNGTAQIQGLNQVFTQAKGDMNGIITPWAPFKVRMTRRSKR
jgi:hypothetical protein